MDRAGFKASRNSFETASQPGDPCGMDDLASLPRRLGQAGTFERGEMEGRRGSRQRKAGGDVSGGQPAWPLGHEQAQEVEPCIHGQGGERDGGFRRFHDSSLTEILEKHKTLPV
jgi:hypothetical protein